ncbi:hypothetical protein E4U55_006535 [Claviceps digitariae]|nr:hypothetical protein E4U55_006535 [Claviceps digitariae]
MSQSRSMRPPPPKRTTKTDSSTDAWGWNLESIMTREAARLERPQGREDREQSNKVAFSACPTPYLASKLPPSAYFTRLVYRSGAWTCRVGTVWRPDSELDWTELGSRFEAVDKLVSLTSASSGIPPAPASSHVSLPFDIGRGTSRRLDKESSTCIS